ncbi:WYL domain-containing protein [Dysgonomonas sp. Marseille-P4677]|uniref:helix-turn-helix transcriptional regulator n=1 Tax=Dysgonomonas sp. Marseille-P4677 TaxID=2364790 RepID=UPI0019148F4E|nr:WYL domain-containing protein [Dysgonomonas sp. Marseille-P4677]MBK5720191.1 WYL domain-containing protein [Dysgonomonas sp. Marseille-P4677]
MATNKHAMIRYRALDKCFSNFGRKFFINDLIEACDKAIYEYSGSDIGISRRQIFEDIKYMESDEGWSIPLERLNEGRKIYYRYENSSFSINQQPLSPMEMDQLKDTIYMLNRFSGMPHFDWMYEILARFETSFNLKGDTSNVVSFEENPDLKGLYFFSDLFNHIINKQVIRITYKRFSKPAYEAVFHPYHLKQYNNRWFLFGYNPEFKDKYPITSLALDRIEQIKTIQEKYIENDSIDFYDYFYDVVGVSVPENQEKERIILKANNKAYHYIVTKPMHASQKVLKYDGEIATIELNLIINYEFETLLLGYANELEIIAPLYLREKIRERADKVISKNS